MEQMSYAGRILIGQSNGVRMNRIDMLREGAAASGLTMDFLEALTQGLSRQALRKVIGNASSMPSYMKSSDNPNLCRKASAPSSDSR